MALQSNKLVMLGLGMLNDPRPNPQQPRLVDGIHLRWAFKSELGFPWYGFHLFRRTARTAAATCFSSLLSSTAPGSYPSISAGGVTIQGVQNVTLTSARAISYGGGLRISFSSPIHWARLSLRFNTTSTSGITIRAYGDPEGQSLVLEDYVQHADNVVIEKTLAADLISVIELAGPPADLITAPLTASLVNLCYTEVRQETGGWEKIPGFEYPLCLPVYHPDYPCHPSRGEDYGRSWRLARGRIRYGDPYCAQNVRYKTGLIAVTNGSPLVVGIGTSWTQDLVGTVLQIGGDLSAYTIAAVLSPTLLLLSRPYRGASSTSTGYEIREDEFGQLFGHLVTLVAGGPAAGSMGNRSEPASVAAAGSVQVTSGSTTVVGTGTSWGQQHKDLTFIVEHAAPGKVLVTPGSRELRGAGTTWVQGHVGMLLQIAGDPTYYQVRQVLTGERLRLNRVVVNSAGGELDYTLFDPAPYRVASVTSATRLELRRAFGQQGGSGRAYRIFNEVLPDDDTQPRLPLHYPIDFILLAALNPKYAQMLGLAWVDQQAGTGVAYDYLIMADYTGATEHSAERALQLVAAGNFSQVEAYILFNKRKETPAELARPTGLQGYALPGLAVKTKPQYSSLPPAQLRAEHMDVFSCNAGLVWNTERTFSGGLLLSDRAVLYHVWRAGLGTARPAEPWAVAPSYSIITANQPVLVTDSTRASGGTPQRPPDWPSNVNFHLIDQGLQDGWYSYQVNGIDIFGRYSRNSDSSRWYQWGPVPTPKPWYYIDPPGFRTVHTYAVELRDMVGPPPPAGIEAMLIDPQDPTAVKTPAYQAWLLTLPAGERATAIALRVRWRWGQQQMLQAPDAKEFRIYYDPDDAPGSRAGKDWAARIQVVGYGQNVTVSADGATRTYEVFIRVTGSTYSHLTPSLASPRRYAHIAVSAADNKTYVVDSTGRSGNEGPVGPPARVVRVWRQKPAPPAPVEDSERVYASHADYHNRSYYTYRWTAQSFLKAHVFRALDETLFQVDWAQRPRAALTTSDAAFPPSWPATDPRRGDVVTRLNALNGFGGNKAAALAHYRALTNDALRVLASLPGNERAFAQITAEPLDGSSYTDTLDGRATNRYFYRAAYVDGAHNLSPLGLANPPVWLPDILPPQTPQIVSITGSQGEITVNWLPCPDSDVRQYFVYRSSGAAEPASLRQMTLVHTALPSDVDLSPGDHIALRWTDRGVTPGGTYYYRVTAEDSLKNMSAPSRALGVTVTARPPSPPTWEKPAWVVLNSNGSEAPWPSGGTLAAGQRAAIRLGWSSSLPAARFVVSRRVRGESSWKVVADKSGYQALGGNRYRLYDIGLLPREIYQYRIRAISEGGETSAFFSEAEALLPA